MAAWARMWGARKTGGRRVAQTDRPMSNMSVRLVSFPEADVLVFLHAYRAPEPSEWAKAMSLIQRQIKVGDFRRLRCIAVSDGGGPDTVQRGELQALYKAQNHTIKTAAMSTSLVTRGIVAAVSWFNPHVKAYSPGHFADALAYLDLPRAHQARLLREYADMQKEVPANSCLTLIRGASAQATL